MDRRWVSSRALDLIPGLLAIGVFAVWSELEGGFDPTAWYPGTLFLLGALLATGLALRHRGAPLPRATVVAAGLLAGFTLWSFLSITWADVPGDAWDGANRTLLYLIVFMLFALPGWRAGPAATLFGLYAVAIGVVAALTVLELVSAAEPAELFIGGRLIEPTGYQNAVSALLIGGLWPALLLSSRREVPWLLRGLFMAIAGLLLQVALLPQSRGMLLVLPLALLLLFAIVPSRLRTLSVVVPVALGTLLTAPRLLDVYDAVPAGAGANGALNRAAIAIGLSFLALFAVGSALALLDRRFRLPSRTRAMAGRAALGLACLAALAGVVAGVAAIGNPIDWADERLTDFKGGYDDSFEGNRFSGDLGSNRYDFWRVGIGTSFADSPLTGAGADNFATDYLLERRSDEEPRYPHSLPVRVLAGTGLVGALLLGGFLIAAVVGAAGRLRREPPGLSRALGATALVAVAYWFMHSSGDWLWSFPAVTAPAFAWLGMAGTIAPTRARPRAAPGHEREEPSGSRAASTAAAGSARRPALAGSPAVLALAVVLCLVAAASLLAPWLSARYVDGASSSWIADPEGAYAQLDRARTLNPLSARPDLVGGAIAARYEDLPRADGYFRDALGREPRNWYALLELGVSAAQAGDPDQAGVLLGRARALNPRDPLIRQSARRVAAGRVITLSQVDQGLMGRVCQRLGRTDGTASC